MKEKQQTKKEIATETNSLSFEKELLSLIKVAMVNGYSQNQIIRLVKEYWNNNLPDLPAETEDEIDFRKKVERFMEAKYEEFDEYSNMHYFKGSGWFWTKTDQLSSETKRKFICEVCCTIYKGFKMDTFDRELMKKVNVERTKILFPDLKGHVLFYKLILSYLLGYVYNYEVEENEKDVLEKYLSNFELLGKDDVEVVKFIWLIENFD